MCACDQRVYIRREEEQLLKKLYNKVKAQADAVRHCACCPFPSSCTHDVQSYSFKVSETLLPLQVDKPGADGSKDEEKTKLKARR